VVRRSDDPNQNPEHGRAAERLRQFLRARFADDEMPDVAIPEDEAPDDEVVSDEGGDTSNQAADNAEEPVEREELGDGAEPD
jgi:hypothetical protein